MAENHKSVLIVDDDLTLREMYEEYLKASGFTVISAQDGEEGLAQAKESKPTAILLDLMMPKMNGIEVLRHLKADPSTQPIPVIVFTALIQDLEKQESFNAGASDYVVKTEVTPKAILDKIHKFADMAEGAPPADASSQPKAPADANPAESPAPASNTSSEPTMPPETTSPVEAPTVTPIPEPMASTPEPTVAPAPPTSIPTLEAAPTSPPPTAPPVTPPAPPVTPPAPSSTPNMPSATSTPPPLPPTQ